MLGFSRRFVADRIGLDEDRLSAIELGQSPPSATEIELLARFYGLDDALLENEPIVIRRGEGIELLALSKEQPIDPETRTRIIGAANAARDLVDLEAALGLPARYAQWAQRVPPPRRGKDDAPFAVGAGWARAARKHLGLRGVVASVRDLLRDSWPFLRVLYADLGWRSDVTGVTFVDQVRGPTIVLNMLGRNENALVRRFSLAHEFAHVLIDYQRGQPLELFSTYKHGESLDIEARANAFAVRFLCPEPVARRLAEDNRERPLEAVKALVDTWGLHYAAARLYLNNLGHLYEIPPQPPVGLLTGSGSLAARARWELAEAPPLPARFPLTDVPPERQTDVAELAARLFAAGQISRGRLCEYLEVSRQAAVERVVDHFGLTPE